MKVLIGQPLFIVGFSLFVSKKALQGLVHSKSKK
jgi:hypothetical protein